MENDFASERRSANRLELVERISRAIPEDGAREPIKGVHLRRISELTDLVHGVIHPSFCVVAQGAKEIRVGEDLYRYDPHHYLLSTFELPIVSRLIEASPEKPHLSLRLDLNPTLIASVMLDGGMSSPKAVGTLRALDVKALDTNLLDAVVRLTRLFDAPPSEKAVLLPLVVREIVLRLLTGESGERLRQIAIFGGHTDRIAKAIERLRTDFNHPLRIEILAREVGMSPSGFHEHFKAVTAMSPLQFQKQLRLQEARRLMLGEHLDASSAAYRVGYDDTSHFSREYKRHFGSPPIRDVERLRQKSAV